MNRAERTGPLDGGLRKDLVVDRSRDAGGYQALCDGFEQAVAELTGSLEKTERGIVEVTSAYVTQTWNRLEALAAGVPENGLTGEIIAETCLQCTIYGGVARFPEGLRVVQDGLARAGLDLSFAFGPDEDVGALADDMRRLLHGGRHRDDHADPDNGFSGPLYEIVARHGYGKIWTRPGLTLRQRLICAVGALAIIGPMAVTRKFVLTATDHGISTDVLREIVTATVIFQGSPKTLHALMDAERTLADRS